MLESNGCCLEEGVSRENGILRIAGGLEDLSVRTKGYGGGGLGSGNVHASRNFIVAEIYSIY